MIRFLIGMVVGALMVTNASAIEMPPLKPPQVIIKFVLGTNSSFFEKYLMGNHSEIYLHNNTIGTANTPDKI